VNPGLRGLARHLLGMLATFAAIGVPTYFLFEHIANPPGAWTELVKANPEFQITRTPSHRLLIITDGANKRAFLSDDYAGDFKLEPLACKDVQQPAWFRLPPDAHGETCLRANEVVVINFLTAMKIPALWDQFYRPLAESMESDGGYSIGDGELGPDGLLVRDASMRYRVGDTVRISAYYLRNKTLAIVYFEPER